MNQPSERTFTGTTYLASPTLAQKVVLREIQNTAKQCTDLLRVHREFGEKTGDIAPPSFYTVYQRHLDRGRLLEAIARAGGVPTNWIAHARDKGERSIAWHDAQKYWPDPAPVGRSALISNLSREGRTLRLALAVSAIGKIFGANGERLWELGALNHFMDASRERIAAIGWMLNPTAAEREQIWSSSPDWAYTAVATVRDWDAHTLTAWRDRELNLPESAEMHRERLLAALPITDSHPLVPPYPDLVELVGVAHRSLEHPTERLADDATAPTAQNSPGHGEAIGHAIAVASLNVDEHTPSELDETGAHQDAYSPPQLDIPGPEP